MITSFIMRARSFLREYGLKFTLQSAIRYLGIYSTVRYPITIRYPITGIKVKVGPSHIVFWKEELETGRWELDCIKFVSNVIRKGQTILDVGAWIGPYTLLFSKLVQATGQVYAIEPDPKAFYFLRDNIKKNYLTNVHADKICLSNSLGKTKLKSYQFGDSGSSLVKCNWGLREITVKTTTIDKYCRENGIAPDGIKIDVEGAEGLVIEGASKVIKKHRPWVLLEFHHHLMSEKERRTNWQKIVGSAKNVVFIAGNSSQYCYGREVNSLPNCAKFHVFIKY